MSEMLDPSPTVIWFPSLVSTTDDSNDKCGKARRPTRSDRTRRAEDERARLIRLIG